MEELFLSHHLKELMLQFKNEKHGFHNGILCVHHYEMFANEENPNIYKVAAAIELLILAYDIIDDLQDNDTDYVWCKIPEQSLNIVLSALFISMNTIRNSGFEHSDLAAQIMHEYSLKSISGQQDDLLNSCCDETSYLQMIEQKSGSLVAMSCLIGSCLATGQILPEVQTYSTYIGIIQQIKNDISDLKVWSKKNDLLQKKFSLPIIYFLSLDNEISDNIKNYYYSDKELKTSDFPLIKEELINSGAIRYALVIKNIYKNKVLEILNKNTHEKHLDYILQLVN